MVMPPASPATPARNDHAEDVEACAESSQPPAGAEGERADQVQSQNQRRVEPLDLAHGLGIEATAEGVETEEQAAWIRELDCDHGQGWRFGRPARAGATSS